MKRIIVSACLLLTFACGIFALEQPQKRNVPRGGRRKQITANRPPKIKSFSPSASIALIPCSWGLTCTPSDSLRLRLMTDASDPNRDTLTYKYSVSAGQISGQGSNIEWNLKGVAPGSYTAKVLVSDQRKGIATATTTVKVEVCPNCDPPCTVLEVSCPIDVEPGRSIIFTASISGGPVGLQPTYKWSLPSGTSIKGQGTSVIEVDTTGLAGQRITATVVVGGLPPECNREASCITQIRHQATGVK